MPVIRKEVIGPGVVVVEDDDGQPVLAEFTPGDIDHWYSEGKKMLRAQLSIPVPLEHQDVGPVSEADRKANRVKNNAGWVTDFLRVNGKLYADLDIPDADLAKRLSTTVKYVSPLIEPKITDGKGREWKNVISHVALTCRPRWTDQEPFKDLVSSAGADGAALSLAAAPKKLSELARPLQLSMAAAVKSQGEGKWKLADPKQLRVRLAVEPPADRGGKEDDEPDADDLPEPEEKPEPEAESHPLLGKVKEGLRACGIHVSDDVPADLDTFLEHLNTAIQAYLHAKAQGDADNANDPEPSNDYGGDGQPVEEPHAMMMSLDKLAKSEDKAVRTLALSQQKRAKASIESRVKRLKGHVPADVYAELESLVGPSVKRLSLDAEKGELRPTALERTLSLIERSSLDLRKRLSTETVTEEEQPTDDDEKARKAANKTADEMAAMVGVK